MDLSWQQGALAPGPIGRFLVPDPLPERPLYAEPPRRRMRVRFGGAWIADSYHQSTLTLVDGQTFGPHKGLASYDDVGHAHRAARSYREAYPGVARVSDLVSFEPGKVSVQLDGDRLILESGQTVVPHGPDRDPTVDEPAPAGQP